MYSKRTGILQTSSEGLKKIENFNQNLREQYNNRSNSALSYQEKTQNKEKGNLKQNNILGIEEIIIIGLIMMLFLEKEQDLILLSILGLLLIIN